MRKCKMGKNDTKDLLCSVSLDGLLFKQKTLSKIRNSLMVSTCHFLNILAAVSLSKISVVPNKQLEEEISEK